MISANANGRLIKLLRASPEHRHIRTFTLDADSAAAAGWRRVVQGASPSMLKRKHFKRWHGAEKLSMLTAISNMQRGRRRSRLLTQPEAVHVGNQEVAGPEHTRCLPSCNTAMRRQDGDQAAATKRRATHASQPGTCSNLDTSPTVIPRPMHHACTLGTCRAVAPLLEAPIPGRSSGRGLVTTAQRLLRCPWQHTKRPQPRRTQRRRTAAPPPCSNGLRWRHGGPGAHNAAAARGSTHP